jgi:hypothetical protein
MCQACDKLFGNWNKLDSTKEYLEALQNKNYSNQNNTYKYVESNTGNLGDNSGTWVHRKVALRLAQWLSPDFAIQVDDWVEELLTTGTVSLNSPVEKQPELSVEIDIIAKCLSIANLNPALISGIVLNHTADRLPQTRNAVKEAHKLLAATTPCDVLLTPTAIGERLDISAIRVNRLLTSMGMQTPNPSAKKSDPKYFATAKGKQYSQNTIATGITDNTSFQHLKWNEEILELLTSEINK